MNTKRIYDISLPLSASLTKWPGHPDFELTQSKHLSRGDHATVSHIFTGAHAGTHVDAPAHFIQDGNLIDSLDLHLLIGDALVVDTGNAEAISSEVLEQASIPTGTKRLLFRTKNSKRWHDNVEEFTEAYVGLTETGAEWLISRGVKLVGTDYLSVASLPENVPTHRRLLGAAIILVEGLNLYDIAPGNYTLICLPLKIAGAEGAPARVVLESKLDKTNGEV